MPDSGLGSLSLVSKRHAVCLCQLKGWTQENDHRGILQKHRGAEYFLLEEVNGGPKDRAEARPCMRPQQQNPLLNILEKREAALWSSDGKIACVRRWAGL